MTFPSHTAAIHGRIRLLTQLSLLAQLYQVSGQATGCLPGEVIQEGQGLSWVPSCPSRAAGGGKESSLAFPLGIWKSTEGDGAARAYTFPKQHQSTEKLLYGQLCEQPVTAAGWLTAFAVSLSQSLTLTQRSQEEFVYSTEPDMIRRCPGKQMFLPLLSFLEEDPIEQAGSHWGKVTSKGVCD